MAKQTVVEIVFAPTEVRATTPFHNTLRNDMRARGFFWRAEIKAWALPSSRRGFEWPTVISSLAYGSVFHQTVVDCGFSLLLRVETLNNGVVLLAEGVSDDLVQRVLAEITPGQLIVPTPPPLAVNAIPGASAHAAVASSQPAPSFGRRAGKTAAQAQNFPQQDPKIAEVLHKRAPNGRLPDALTETRSMDELVNHLTAAVSIAASKGHTLPATKFTTLPPANDGVPRMQFSYGGRGERTLYRHQMEVLADFSVKYGGRMIVAHEPGMGKTLTAIATFNTHVAHGRLLLVCPEHLRRMWQREFIAYGRDAYVYGLQEMAAKHWSESGNAVLILGYASIIKDTMDKLGRGGLEAIGMIIDESHYCGNKDALRTQRAMAWAERVQHIMCLSGTPSANRIINLWPTLRMVKRDAVPDYFEFGLRYCDGKQGKFGWDFSGASNLEDLAGKLTTVMHRRTKAQAIDLPPKTRTIVPIPIDEAVRLELQSHMRKAMSGDGSSGTGARSHGTAVLGALAAIHVDLWAAKRDGVRAWCADFVRSEKKIVIFTAHVEAAHEIHAYLTKARPDLGFSCVTGDTPDKIRDAAVQQFQNNPATRAIIATLGTLSTGVTLTAASDVAFAELNWTPAVVAQAEDRIHRIGQTEPCTIHYLSAEGTLDEVMARSIASKTDALNIVLGGGDRNAAALEKISDDMSLDILANEGPREPTEQEVEPAAYATLSGLGLSGFASLVSSAILNPNITA